MEIFPNNKSKRTHALSIPLYGELPLDFCQWIDSLLSEGFLVVLVQNNAKHCDHQLIKCLQGLGREHIGLHVVFNRNLGGVAGGFNRGVEYAISEGADWITLLDQDSRLEPSSLKSMLDPWRYLEGRMLVGPIIWDKSRKQIHKKFSFAKTCNLLPVRMLISSGTTFLADEWPQIGSMFEWLFIDYVDHCWCFRARRRGFKLMQYSQVKLVQSFGRPHPNLLCRCLGMELYSSMRHYYQLRNLRWLINSDEAPLDIRCKELMKMLIKPFLWCLFEPNRIENFRSIWNGLRASIPTSSVWK